jgi:excisionase family DNA binding protein
MINTDPAVTKLLTTREAMVRLGYKSKTAHSVLRLIQRGELDAVRLNSRTLRIREAALNDFIQKREGGIVYA